jgi:hypothetical protein
VAVNCAPSRYAARRRGLLAQGVFARSGVIIIAAAFAVIGVFGYSQFRKARQVAEYSAVASLPSQAEGLLESFYCETGAFPPTLDRLRFDFSATDGATTQMLSKLTYESDGQSYYLGFDDPTGDRRGATTLPPALCSKTEGRGERSVSSV